MGNSLPSLSSLLAVDLRTLRLRLSLPALLFSLIPVAILLFHFHRAIASCAGTIPVPGNCLVEFKQLGQFVSIFKRQLFDCGYLIIYDVIYQIEVGSDTHSTVVFQLFGNWIRNCGPILLA
jgi:hypothetical protein